METQELRREAKRAARGDRDAAAILFDEYHPRVFRYALSKLGNAAEAEDVASETFARVLRDLDRFRWKGSGFEAWLFRIAANLVVDMFRTTGRERPEHEVESLMETTTGNEPETLVLRAETSRDLRTLLEDLPEDQREVLLLRFAAGLDTEGAGRVLKRRPNAVRQLQFRALENLRARLAPETVR